MSVQISIGCLKVVRIYNFMKEIKLHNLKKTYILDISLLYKVNIYIQIIKALKKDLKKAIKKHAKCF